MSHSHFTSSKIIIAALFLPFLSGCTESSDAEHQYGNLNTVSESDTFSQKDQRIENTRKQQEILGSDHDMISRQHDVLKKQFHLEAR